MAKHYVQCVVQLAGAVVVAGTVLGYVKPLATLAVAQNPILISEIYPDPSTGKEYIELYNFSAEEALLDGMSVYDVSSPAPGSCENFGKLLTLSGTLAPGEYKAIELSSARLNNSGDRVQLRDSNGIVQDELAYGVCGTVSAEKGFTLGHYFLPDVPIPPVPETQKLSPTPNFYNYFLDVVGIKISSDLIMPLQTIEFEGQLDSSFPIYQIQPSSIKWRLNNNLLLEGNLLLEWVAGGLGDYLLSLEVEDSFGNKAIKEVEFSVGPNHPPPSPVDYSSLIINEVFPSPLDGISEWIELYNTGAVPIDLSGVILDDVQSGGSSPYTFPAGVTIDFDSFLVVTKNESKLTLNNTGDDVCLISPDGKLIQKITYPAIAKGLSYIFFEGGWLISDQPTPGEENYVTPSEDPVHLDPVPINEAKKKVGEKTKTKGVVTATTGDVGESIAYIQDATAGIRVKTTEKLKRGNTYEVYGEVKESWGEVNISALETFEISEKLAVSAFKTTPDKVKIDKLSSLLEVDGVVARVSGGTVWIAKTADSTETVKAYISPSLDWKRPEWIKKGEKIRITGVLSQWGTTADGLPNLRILPRDANDFKLLDANGKVLGIGATVLPKTSGRASLIPGIVGLACGLVAKCVLPRAREAYKLWRKTKRQIPA